MYLFYSQHDFNSILCKAVKAILIVEILITGSTMEMTTQLHYPDFLPIQKRISTYVTLRPE